VPHSSEPRRVDTKPLTTDGPLPVWGTRQGIGLSHRGDMWLATPGSDLPPLRGPRENCDRGHGGDLGLLCDRRTPSPRPPARHLETHGRPKDGVGRPSPNETNTQRKQPGPEGGQDQPGSMPAPHHLRREQKCGMRERWRVGWS